MLVFDDGLARVRDSFTRAMEGLAKEAIELGSTRVVVFEEKWERDTWRIYVTSPRPEILLIATDRDYLTEVLSRMGQRAKTRALPEGLPEWAHVDTSAEFWGVRHYDKGGALTDPTSPLSGEKLAANEPDRQAIGLTFSYTTQLEQFRINYLSANPEAVKIAEQFWKPKSYSLRPRIQAKGSALIGILFTKSDLEPDSILPFLILMSLGHGVFL